MNKGIVGLGIILVVVSVPIIAYSTTSESPENCVTQSYGGLIFCPGSQQPVDKAPLLSSTSQPYLSDGLLVTLVGVVTLIIGFVIPTRE
jgi:hypothetical protein